MSAQTAQKRESGRPQYTRPQLEAISSTSGQTLVSAAAGSGKTHVLTKRIEALVRGADLMNFASDDGTSSDPERMQDIRSMLVVTFTRAAATEMRTRIVKTLTDAAEKQIEAGNERAARQLHEQAEAAAGADISTFHSFCSRVLSEQYELAGLAAGFSILGDDQAEQLRQSIVRDLLDSLYEEKDERAQRLLDRLSKNGDDRDLVRYILDVHARMMSAPDWKEWLTRSLSSSLPVLEEEWDGLRMEALDRAVRAMERVVEIMSREAVDEPLAKKLRNDEKTLDRLLDLQKAARKQGVRRAAAELGGVPRMSSTAKEEGALSSAQDLRENVKADLRLFLDDRFDDRDQTREDVLTARESTRDLTDLVTAFHKKYTERKQALNRVDYADLEHRTLQVLRELNRQGSGLGSRYKHVFVDEYQDTNRVQEEILTELTKGQDSRLFMVGDLKQSIYGFRFADPDIFREKDTRFEEGRTVEKRKIHMNDNFRSTDRVIQAVNAVMRTIMTEKVGGVDYTGSQELALGRRGAKHGRAEILIADADAPDEQGAPLRKARAEAAMIAAKIEQLAAAGRAYGDIAVLTRSRSDRMRELQAALEAKGIPYSAELENERSYTEVDLFLNLLDLLVNERQDVPLLSVMRSYMFGFTEEDFARIARWAEAHRPQPGSPEEKKIHEPFFAQTARFRQAGAAGSGDFTAEDRKLADRLERFFANLQELRTMGTDMPLDRFAEEIASRHDFSSYLLTRPGGASRKLAFEQLLAMIASQQELHGNSLYRVLKAVRGLREQGAGAPASQMIPEAVRMMTIHKSKGLEFPVVFLSGLDSHFNTRALQNPVLATGADGVVMDCLDAENHTKIETIETALARRHILDGQKSEELRALYVTMTRAKEDLYLCGAVKGGPETAEETWRTFPGRFEDAVSMIDWVMGAYYMLADTWEPLLSAKGSSRLRKAQSVLEKAAAAADALPALSADPVRLAAVRAVLQQTCAAFGWIRALHEYSIYTISGRSTPEETAEHTKQLLAALADRRARRNAAAGAGPPQSTAAEIFAGAVLLPEEDAGILEEALRRAASPENGDETGLQAGAAAEAAARKAAGSIMMSGAEDDLRDFASELPDGEGDTVKKALMDAVRVLWDLRYDAMMESLYAGDLFAPDAGKAETEKVSPEENAAALLAEAEKHRTPGRFPGLAERSRVPAVQGVSRRIQARRILRGETPADYRTRTIRPVLAEPEGISGTERGTLLHRALLYAVRNGLPADQTAAVMLNRKLVSEEEAAEIAKNEAAIASFLTSTLHDRAKASPRLLTEQKFRVLIPADEDGTGDRYGRRIRLQGTIDLAFEENGSWILVDYKSDRGTGAEELRRRYEEQIGYYRLALEKTTGKPVREAYLFSLEQGVAIPVGPAGRTASGGSN